MTEPTTPPPALSAARTPSPNPTPRTPRIALGLLAAITALVATPASGSSTFLAMLARHQPGCSAREHAIAALLSGGYAIAATAAAIYLAAGTNTRRWLRLTPPALIALALVFSAACFELPRHRTGTWGVPPSNMLRAYAQARNAAPEPPPGDPAPLGTILLLIHDRSITPGSILLGEACPERPPMPSPHEFDYAGITPAQAYERRITRERIVEAASAVLGDDPWERIGWCGFLRDQRRFADIPDEAIIVAYAFHHTRMGPRVHLAFADATVRGHDPDHDDLLSIIANATTAAERLGVALPPQELIEFARTRTIPSPRHTQPEHPNTEQLP
ncbi:MAG: hypothetical protein ACTS3F_12885 [Phycisphaerales bacterium]